MDFGFLPCADHPSRGVWDEGGRSVGSVSRLLQVTFVSMSTMAGVQPGEERLGRWNPEVPGPNVNSS